MEKFIIIIVLIIIIFVFLRIRVVIRKDNFEKAKIELYIFPKLNIKINLDFMLNKFNCLSINQKAQYIKDSISNLNNKKKIIYDFLKICRLRNIQIKIDYNYIKYPSTLFYVFIWNVLGFIKNFTNKHIRKIDKEDYLILFSENNNIHIYIDMIFPVILLIYISIKNSKFIIKEIIKHGTSNKRTFKTFSRKYNKCD